MIDVLKLFVKNSCKLLHFFSNLVQLFPSKLHDLFRVLLKRIELLVDLFILISKLSIDDLGNLLLKFVFVR